MARRLGPVSRYTGAVLMSGVAASARWLLDPYLGERAPYITNIVAVVVSAWYWGLGPGLLALGLSTAAGIYLFVPPRGTFLLARLTDVLGLSLSLINGTVIVLICEAQRSAHRRAETAAGEASRALESERAQHEQMKTTLDALGESERLFRLLADAMPQIVWVTDPDGRLEYFNRRWFEYTGLTVDKSFAPDGPMAAVHPDDAPALLETAVQTARDRAPFEAEYRLRDRSGHYRWHLGRSLPVRDEAGRDVRRFGTTTDIDDRKRAEHNAWFLAETSALLATLRDEESALGQMAENAVPFFADWGVVDLLRDDGTVKRLTIAQSDPCRDARFDELSRRYPPRTDSPNSVVIRVLQTGRSVLVAELDDETLAGFAVDEDHLGFLRQMKLKSLMVVPLKGRERTLGTISFATAESDRQFGPGDLRLAEDLAHRAAIAIENLRLTQELRDTDRKKDEFLATLAHELRNPLAPVVNALHLMRNQPGVDPAMGFGPEQAMIARQINHLARLVDDLLDVSRISRGKIDLRRQPLELARIVRQAVEATEPLFQAKGHELTVSLPPAPIVLEADPTRLEQILWNLLNNAAKYTEPGGRVELSVGLDPGGRDATIIVRDTGIGIAPDVLPHVFELFVQADGRTDRAQGGLGIGLSLVHELVRMHGGTIQARSAGLGQGSEFIVRLPRCEPLEVEDSDFDASLLPAIPGLSGEPSPTHHRILVVDDNVDAALSLVKVLTRLYGQDVRVAHEGVSALAKAREFRPDLVLLDIGLPGMDGYEVARQIRSSPECEAAVLVAVTGWGQDADRTRAREAGFDRHLVKPVDPDVLRELLCELGASVGKS